jgi:tripartite-type tricarboxylate transporter receptor subunit TctC
MNRKLALLFVAAIGPVALFPRPAAFAQGYPAKPVRLIVAFQPGGGEDFFARLVAPRLERLWGQPVTIENRPGAGGVVGWQYAARAAPDGHTLAFGGGTMTVQQAMRSKPPFDVLRDFTSISLTYQSALLLVVHPSVPARSVNELITLARAYPGKMNYASPGIGALGHLAGELFNARAHVDMVHVPYKGATSIFTDLAGGRVDLCFSTIPSARPYLNLDRVRALAVTGSKRIAVFPELPTIAEAGLPGYDISGWSAVHGPAGLPRDIVDKVNDAFRTVLAMPEVRLPLEAEGREVRATTPEEITAIMKAGVERHGAIIRSAGIKAE